MKQLLTAFKCLLPKKVQPKDASESTACNTDGCSEDAHPRSAQGPEGPPDDHSGAQAADAQAEHPQDAAPSHDGVVRIGVGNTAAIGDISIDVTDNQVTGGQQGVHIGSGNQAAGANTGFISGNVADCHQLLVGVDNYCAEGDNDIRVHDNDFRGVFDSVHVGVGNYAGGSNKIIVRGPGEGGRGPPSTLQPTNSFRPNGPYDGMIVAGGYIPPMHGYGPSGPYSAHGAGGFGPSNLYPSHGAGGFGPVGPYYGSRPGLNYGYNSPATASGMAPNTTRPPFGNPQ